jgi:hypothetical protein
LPHAHAEQRALDAAGALALPGVECVVTGADARSHFPDWPGRGHYTKVL